LFPTYLSRGFHQAHGRNNNNYYRVAQTEGLDLESINSYTHRSHSLMVIGYTINFLRRKFDQFNFQLNEEKLPDMKKI
jgi:hypothetical protein